MGYYIMGSGRVAIQGYYRVLLKGVLQGSS